MDDLSSRPIQIAGGTFLGAVPKKIRDAMIKAITDGIDYPYTNYNYPPGEGVPEFKEAVAEYYHRRWNVDYDPGQILPTCGAHPALCTILYSVLKPGDEVLVTDPGFYGHYSQPRYCGCVSKPFPCKKDRWHFDPEDLRAAVTDKTKMIMLCSPNNPTGTVFTRQELTAVAEVAEEHDLLILSDEIYQEFVYDGREAIMPEQIKGLKERTLISNSVSKVTNGTGLRLGFLIAPEELYPKVLRYYFEHGRPKPPTIVQLGGVAAYEQPMDYVEEIRKEYERRRNFFVPRINEIEGLSVPMFEGALYPFVDISGVGVETADFLKGLKEKEKVSVMNGERQGINLSKKHIRFALREPTTVLEEACNRIERFVNSL